MSDFDTTRMYYDLASDEGPACGDEIGAHAWDVVREDVRAWLVRPC